MTRTLSLRWSVLFVTLLVGAATPFVGSAFANQPKPAAKSSVAPSLVADLMKLLAVFREEGPTLRPLLPRSTILSASLRLPPEAVAIVMRRLSDPTWLARLQWNRPEVANVLAGLARALPLLREIEPEVQLVVSRQSFRDVGAAVPRWKLPGVALVFIPRDTLNSKRLYLTAYWAAMLQASESARAMSRPQLRLERRRFDQGVFYGATFVPLTGAKYQGLIDYNITPAIGFVGTRFILSSSKELALQLVELAAQEEKVVLEQVPGNLRIDVGPVAACEVLCDNVPAVAGLIFAEKSLALGTVNRRTKSGSIFLALLPHWTWQLPCRSLFPWLEKERKPAPLKR